MSIWTDKVEELNKLYIELESKPESEKRGFSGSAGGILNAYREGDLNWNEAEKALYEWKAREMGHLKVRIVAIARSLTELAAAMPE